MRTEIGPGGHLRVRTEQGPVIWSPEERMKEFHDQPPVIFTYLSVNIFKNLLIIYFIYIYFLLKIEF